MLQNIRDNSQGWIAKVIIGVIVLLMAFTGFDAIVRSTSHSQDAAEVNGEKITQASLAQAADMQRRQLIQQFGQQFDPSMLDDKMLRESALKSLIARMLLLQGAKNSGFAVSQESLDQLIVRTPDFQVDGKFSAERFDQVIRQLGYSRMQFRQMFEQDVLISQLQAGLAGSGFVTDDEMQAFARLEKQTRDFATLTLRVDSKSVQVSDDDIRAYHDQHTTEFMSPEQVVLEYVELKKDAFFNQVTVKDEDLQAQYQKEIANLAEQREAAHILVEVNDKQSEAQAKAKIEEAQKRLAKGEAFATVAKDLSEDPGSSANGGDLGFAGPGVYDPAFEKALYALKKGETSEPVRSEFGWHLIKLLDVQAPQVPSFASLKDKLEHDLKAQQVEQKFVEATKSLEDSAFEASDLNQPAQDHNLKVQTSAPFGREGGEGLAANRQVVQAAFSQEVLEDGSNSGAIELDPDTVVILRVKEHKKPEPLALEQVAGGIRERLSRERASAAAKEKGEKLLADLRAGQVPADKPFEKQDWKVTEAATRAQEGIEPQVLQALFRMPAPGSSPTFAGVSLGNGDFVVLRLNGVSEPQGPLSEQEKTSYRRFLASRSGQQDFNAFRKQLEATADIERY
jgi:peptidyl-prolyl cis-trans isomerase D